MIAVAVAAAVGLRLLVLDLPLPPQTPPAPSSATCSRLASLNQGQQAVAGGEGRGEGRRPVVVTLQSSVVLRRAAALLHHRPASVERRSATPQTKPPTAAASPQSSVQSLARVPTVTDTERGAQQTDCVGETESPSERRAGTGGRARRRRRIGRILGLPPHRAGHRPARTSPVQCLSLCLYSA